MDMPPPSYVNGAHENFNPRLQVIHENPQFNHSSHLANIPPKSVGNHRVGGGAFGNKMSIHSSNNYSSGSRNLGDNSPAMMIPGPREFHAKRRSGEDVEMDH
mmetsp:Transcript_26500/g.40454  ORF Transcript_26500/g.40454 Transcript_26500/m.40454 type:complete len:102 (-) Transcript_26500:128-433(-)